MTDIKPGEMIEEIDRHGFDRFMSERAHKYKLPNRLIKAVNDYNYYRDGLVVEVLHYLNENNTWWSMKEHYEKQARTLDTAYVFDLINRLAAEQQVKGWCMLQSNEVARVKQMLERGRETEDEEQGGLT
jgi:hypothetical protein